MKLFNILEDPPSLEESCFSPFEGHTYAVNWIDFSNDSTQLVSCSQDGTTIVWHSQVQNYITQRSNNRIIILDW